MEKYRGEPEAVYLTNNSSTRPVSFNGKREPDIEARVCAPEFWVPKSHLIGWAKGFGWFLVGIFAGICMVVGAYHVVGSVKDFLGGMA